MWLNDRKNRDLVQQALWIACGLAHVEMALAGLDGLLRTLRRNGGRTLSLHPPGYRAGSTDERPLLALNAAPPTGRGSCGAGRCKCGSFSAGGGTCKNTKNKH